ncbi:MAG: 16S rRNA processing protein RimM [Candidatus Neomarinimicrobiota bacterium]|nr:MAG: 16S rRNA processing protein RimM [Candidatus Neomarinimicrobiota bacterium]
MPMSEHRLFPIARITQVAGLKGEVRMRPLSRYFEEYIDKKPIYLGLSEEYSRETRIVQKVGLGKRVRFRFDGIDSREEAESLIGQTVFVPVDDQDGIIQVSEELIGSMVMTDSGVYIGELTEILWLPANDVYVIRQGTKEVLIPVIPEIVKEVDLDEGVIVIHPMDGLMD